MLNMDSVVPSRYHEYGRGQLSGALNTLSFEQCQGCGVQCHRLLAGGDDQSQRHSPLRMPPAGADYVTLSRHISGP